MRTISVLIVEDEQIVGEDIRISLKKIGYDVINVVSSGESALSAISFNSMPDLVLMDIVLKGDMNGIETAEKINKSYDIPVIFLTSHADEDTIERAKFSQPYGYILKPFNESELKSTIEIAVYKHSMEKKLRKNEAWLSTIFNCIGEGIIVLDKNGMINFMNPVAEKLTGWKKEDALNKFWKYIYKIVDNNFIKYLKNDRYPNQFFSRNDTYLTTKKNYNIPINHSIVSIKDAKDIKLGNIIVFHDIINRKASEEALKESEERYRTLFEDSGDAIFIATKTGKFHIANQSAIDLFGYSRKNLLKINIKNIFKNSQDWEIFNEKIIKDGLVRNYEVQFKNKKNEVLDCILSVNIRKTKNNRILGFQGIVCNVTEKKHAEEILRKSEQRYRLLRLSKNQPVFQFICLVKLF